MSVTGYGGRKPGKHNYSNGLRLDISPKGKSVWVARVKIDGKYVTRKLADANEKCDRDDAWRLLREFKAMADQGEVKVKSSYTLGKMMTAWSDDKIDPGREKPWSERHHQKTVSRLKKALGDLWDTRMEDITLRGLNTHLIDWVGQGNSRDTAGRVWGWVREAWEEQVNLGNFEYCPLNRKPDRLRVRKGEGFPSYGADIPKLRKLYHAIRLSDHARSVRHVGQLCLLTGLRISEITKLELSDIRGNEIWVPRERMKVKDTRKRSAYFIVPITGSAQAIIDEAIEAATSECLFPGPRTGKPISSEGVEKMYAKLSGMAHTPHGCRKSLNSWAIEQGYSLQACKALLDHDVFSDVTQRYTVVELKEDRRQILTAWDGEITSSNVIRLKNPA